MAHMHTHAGEVQVTQVTPSCLIAAPSLDRFTDFLTNQTHSILDLDSARQTTFEPLKHPKLIDFTNYYPIIYFLDFYCFLHLLVCFVHFLLTPRQFGLLMTRLFFVQFSCLLMKLEP